MSGKGEDFSSLLYGPVRVLGTEFFVELFDCLGFFDWGEVLADCVFYEFYQSVIKILVKDWGVLEDYSFDLYSEFPAS